MYHKVRKGIDAVQYFTTNGWLFRSNNVVALVDELSATDKQVSCPSRFREEELHVH